MAAVLVDAVELCRRLSIRYLWVDAVCIIQGSKEDWQREAALMGQVYANAFVTICSELPY
jgi:hypothetical protein